MARLARFQDAAGGFICLAEKDGVFHALPQMLGRSVTDPTELMGDWEHNLKAIEAAIAAGAAPVDIAGMRFAPPIARPGKLICIGVNYHDHIAEMGVNAPEFPYAFLRPFGCLAAHGEAVTLPDWPKMVDWEAELGVVIGRTCRGLTNENALSAVAGYTVINDVSARDWIESAPFVGIDWVMQKAWDGFQPTGPFLVPARHVPDPQALELELSVNGTVKQKQSTAKMVFGVVDILVHLSRIMTLCPGDIIATGTPSGVGFGRRPREFLADGDTVSVSITGLGELINTFAAAR